MARLERPSHQREHQLFYSWLDSSHCYCECPSYINLKSREALIEVPVFSAVSEKRHLLQDSMIDDEVNGHSKKTVADEAVNNKTEDFS